MRNHRLMQLAILASGLASVAQAATITYDEAVSGDLPYGGRGTVPTLFSFDAGINSVQGTETFFTNNGSTTVDGDGFRFSLGAGQVLTSVIFEYSGTQQPMCQEFTLALAPDALGSNPPSTALAKTSASLGAPGSCQVQIAPIVPSGSPVFGEALPLGAEIYELSDTGGQFGGQGADGLLHYKFTFNVTAVPAPGALALFGTAILSVLPAGLRRRMRR